MNESNVLTQLGHTVAFNTRGAFPLVDWTCYRKLPGLTE